MKRIKMIILAVLVASLWGLASFGAARAEETAFSRDDEVVRQVETLQEKMLNDTEIMALIAQLKNDPEMQRLLNDPAAIEAAQKRNINALVANPHFKKLLDNPRVREIQRKVNP